MAVNLLGDEIERLRELIASVDSLVAMAALPADVKRNVRKGLFDAAEHLAAFRCDPPSQTPPNE